MVNKIGEPSQVRPMLKDDGTPSQELFYWIQTLTERSMIIGTGAPEDVVSATQASIYMNDAGSASSIVYIKRVDDISGDTKKGWVLI